MAHDAKQNVFQTVKHMMEAWHSGDVTRSEVVKEIELAMFKQSRKAA